MYAISQHPNKQLSFSISMVNFKFGCKLEILLNKFIGFGNLEKSIDSKYPKKCWLK